MFLSCSTCNTNNADNVTYHAAILHSGSPLSRTPSFQDRWEPGGIPGGMTPTCRYRTGVSRVACAFYLSVHVQGRSEPSCRVVFHTLVQDPHEPGGNPGAMTFTR